MFFFFLLNYDLSFRTVCLSLLLLNVIRKNWKNFKIIFFLCLFFCLCYFLSMATHWTQIQLITLIQFDYPYSLSLYHLSWWSSVFSLFFCYNLIRTCYCLLLLLNLFLGWLDVGWVKRTRWMLMRKFKSFYEKVIARRKQKLRCWEFSILLNNKNGRFRPLPPPF